MKRRIEIALVPLLCAGLLLGYDSGLPDSMHLKLTNVLFGAASTTPANLAPLVLDPASYPDLFKFRQAILDGVNTENCHYDPSDPNTEYWAGNEGQWETSIRASKYPNGEFEEAYRQIGYYLHLTQDSTVPAHNRVIFHAYPSVYYAFPGGPLLDATVYHTERGDNFEFAAPSYDFATLPANITTLDAFMRVAASDPQGTNAPQSYFNTTDQCSANNDFKTPIQRKLWLCDAEAAAKTADMRLCDAGPRLSWGLYSFPEARGCAFPPLGGDLDWFPRGTDGSHGVEAPQTAHEIGRTAVYLAIRLGSEALQRFSKTLPPVVTEPQGRISTDLSNGQKAQFSLPVQENRTEAVYVRLKDAATGLPLSGLTLSTLRGSRPDGAVLLANRMDWDLATLPWADSVRVTWDGTLGDGMPVGAGDRTLVYEVTDADGNSTTGKVTLWIMGVDPPGPLRRLRPRAPVPRER